MSTNVEHIQLHGVGMKCPVCTGKTRIKDTRASADGIRRRRYCKACKTSFSTLESFVAFDARGGRSIADSMERRLRDEAKQFAKEI